MDSVLTTLRFELHPGHSMEARAVGEALIAWQAALRDANSLIDPASELVVEVLGFQEGSLSIPAILRFVEHRVLGKASSALAPYPKIKAALVLNVFMLPGAITGGALSGILTNMALPAAQQASSEAARAAEEAAERLEKSPVVQSDVRRFFSSIDGSRDVSAVEMYHEDIEDPIVAVPHERFAERSGLWLPQPADPETRKRSDVWDVIVTHPAAIGKPRVWRFKRDGLPFKAKMVDPHFLKGISERTLPLQVHEGTVMRVSVVWTERLAGDAWDADQNSFEIVEVVWPTATARTRELPLFPVERHPPDHASDQNRD